MKIIPASYAIESAIDAPRVYTAIERAGRTCYKSEDLITEASAEKFVRMLVKRGHEAMIEHQSMTVRFIIDRGISHELVRHRIASFAQESSRYCNYGKGKFGQELTYIKPQGMTIDQEAIWTSAARQAETHYFAMLDAGAAPQIARDVLLTSTKTEVVVTANFREWRTILQLRTSMAAHPQIREVMFPLLLELKAKLPALFEDIEVN